MIEHKTLTLSPFDGEYYNFAEHTMGPNSLAAYLEDGWIIENLKGKENIKHKDLMIYRWINHTASNDDKEEE